MKSKCVLFFVVLVCTQLSLAATKSDVTGKTVITCSPVRPMPDTSFSLSVKEGGKTGFVIVEQQFFLGKRQPSQYLVKEDLSNKDGAGDKYVGRQAKLSIAWTTTPLLDGGHLGHWQVTGEQLKEVSCRRH